MRVMALGDTHGDGQWAIATTRIAGAHGAQRVLQVGDFGFWPRVPVSGHATHADWFLGDIASACDEYGVTEWIVIDGNHDDHLSLTQLDTPPDEDGMIRLHRCVRYSPRGNSFSLGGRRFGTLGGAASIDAYLDAAGIDIGLSQPYRRDWDWFPDLERPTEADVDRLPPDLDVLLAHEAPIEVNLKHLNGFPGVYIPPEIQLATEHPRNLVSIAMHQSQPQLLIHGHWHGRNHVVIDRPHFTCEVIGLSSNSKRRGRDERSLLFLDLPDLTIRTLKVA